MDPNSPPATPPANPPADPGSPPATPPANPSAWYDTFQDPGVKDWLKSYGNAYPNAEAVALKAQNLEKFLGAEKAGRGVIVPKSDAPPEEWQSFYKKVGGVPDKPDGYKIPQELAADPAMNGFRDAMHKAGMPPMLFDAAMSWYAGFMKDAQGRQDAEFERQSEQEMRTLEQKWSGKDGNGVPVYDKNLELARRAMRQFMPHANPAELETRLNKMEGALGPLAMMEMFANIGGAMGEHIFHGGGDGGGGGAMTAEAARVRIAELTKDVAFRAKLVSKDAAAVSEWDRLHKTAYGQ